MIIGGKKSMMSPGLIGLAAFDGRTMKSKKSYVKKAKPMMSPGLIGLAAFDGRTMKSKKSSMKRKRVLKSKCATPSYIKLHKKTALRKCDAAKTCKRVKGESGARCVRRSTKASVSTRTRSKRV
jgi:hypothetical protein